MAVKKSGGLGRGLSALFVDTSSSEEESDHREKNELKKEKEEPRLSDGSYLKEIDVESISPNPQQPRQVFDEDELDELASSIKECGLLQPIVVTVDPDEEDRYILVMGERRWRAHQQAGLKTITAIVRATEDQDLLRDALLENLHRVQLNPLEEAAAYQQLLEEFSCTQEELSTRIKRSRPHISNTLRLLQLPPSVQRRVAAGILSAGHARAILTLPDGLAMEELAQRIVSEGMSVRASEEAALMIKRESPVKDRKKRRPHQLPSSAQNYALQLSDRLDTRVQVTMGARRGRLAIDFADLEDLERIMALLGQS